MPDKPSNASTLLGLSLTSRPDMHPTDAREKGRDRIIGKQAGNENTIHQIKIKREMSTYKKKRDKATNKNKTRHKTKKRRQNKKGTRHKKKKNI